MYAHSLDKSSMNAIMYDFCMNFAYYFKTTNYNDIESKCDLPPPW